ATGGFKSVIVGTGICAMQLNDVATCFSGPEESATSVPPASEVGVGDGWACILLADHTAMCWGENYYGQLGTGAGSDAPILQPVPAVAGMKLRSISLGTGPDTPGKHSCGLDMGGHAYCWGDNTAHQIGAPVSQPLAGYLITLAPTRVTRTRLQ